MLDRSWVRSVIMMPMRLECDIHHTTAYITQMNHGILCGVWLYLPVFGFVVEQGITSRTRSHELFSWCVDQISAGTNSSDGRCRGIVPPGPSS